MSVFINHGVYLLFSFKYDFDNDGYGRTRWSQHVLCSSCLWSWSLCPADAVLCMWCRCSLWSCASYSRWLGAILHPWLALPPVSCRVEWLHHVLLSTIDEVETQACGAVAPARGKCSTGRCVPAWKGLVRPLVGRGSTMRSHLAWWGAVAWRCSGVGLHSARKGEPWALASENGFMVQVGGEVIWGPLLGMSFFFWVLKFLHSNIIYI